MIKNTTQRRFYHVSYIDDHGTLAYPMGIFRSLSEAEALVLQSAKADPRATWSVHLDFRYGNTKEQGKDAATCVMWAHGDVAVRTALHPSGPFALAVLRGNKSARKAIALARAGAFQASMDDFYRQAGRGFRRFDATKEAA